MHSLVDGALIVAALAVGVVPGAVATMAVTIHEVPRRIAIVTLLVRAGCRPTLALGLTACAGMGTVLGGMIAPDQQECSALPGGGSHHEPRA